MNRDDIKPFTEILKFLAEGLDAKLSSDKIKFYFAALNDLDLDDIKKAASHIARNATFFPKPAEFRKFIQGDIETVAIGAWEKALKGKSRAGQYQSVQFDDPVIHGVVKLMGGWPSFCSMEDYKEEKWQRADFEKIYKSIQDQKEGHPKHSLGLAELQQDARRPYDKARIVQIGPIEERKVIETPKREELPAPEKILSQEEVSERIRNLCDNIKTVEDGPLDEETPCTIE